MKEESGLIIVPDERILDAPVFERKLNNKERHITYIKEFCDTYKTPEFVPEMNNNTAPFYLNQYGHLVIKTSCDTMSIVLFYIPEQLTLNEKNWLDENVMKYYSFQYTGFYYFDGKKRIVTSNFNSGLKLIKIAIDKFRKTECWGNNVDFKK